MFRGAYHVYKVNHSITPHHVITKFTGTRVKRTKTPLIDSTTLYMSLLGSLNSMGGKGVKGGNGTSTSKSTPNLEIVNESDGLYKEVNGSLYVVDESNGVAGATLRKFMEDLSNYLKAELPNYTVDGVEKPRNLALASNGITRSLQDTVAGGPARDKASKHGCGLAIDVVFTGVYNGVNLGNPYKTDDKRQPYGWVNGNLTVVKDNAVMTKIKQFLSTSEKWKDMIKWGGDFKNSGTKGRQTITSTVTGFANFEVRRDEIHHFEIKDDKMAQFFDKWKPQLDKLGLKAPTGRKSLTALYQKAFDFEQDNKKAGQDISSGTSEQGDSVDLNTNINS
jgi:hypothetical protein